MSRYWFRQRRYGIGARPNTWQGWLVVAFYIASLAIGAYLMDAPIVGSGDQPLRFVVFAIALTAAFLVFSWRMTEGGWRWRWGGDD